MSEMTEQMREHVSYIREIPPIYPAIFLFLAMAGFHYVRPEDKSFAQYMDYFIVAVLSLLGVGQGGPRASSLTMSRAPKEGAE